MNIIICDDRIDEAKRVQKLINQVYPCADIMIFENKEMINDLFKKTEDGDYSGASVIKIKTVKGYASIALHEIAFVEVILHNVYFNLMDGKVLVSNSALKEIAYLLLADKRFSYCHRSYIVNIDAILHIGNNEITLKNNKVIPISRTHYSKIQKSFQKRV